MTKILSADMISKQTIKRLVNKSGIAISDSAADALARLLEKKAKKIASYAVKRAKDSGRKSVLEEDIDTYGIKFGD
jgi:histone H3/H4